MIQFLKDVDTRIVSNLAGGEGNMYAKDLVKVLPPNLRLFSQMTLEPGTYTGLHPHPGETEIVHIISGAAKLTDNDRTEILYPGDTHICYNGDQHAIATHGDEPMVFIACFVYN